MSGLRRAGLALAVTLTGLSSRAETVATRDCPAADVLSFYETAVGERDIRRQSPPSAFGGIGTAEPDHSGLRVTIRGPVLGSMDRRDVLTALSCVENGVAVSIEMIRSADFTGEVQKDVLWRPDLTLVLRPSQPRVRVVVTWRMRLTSGRELDRMQTPPFPAHALPIVGETIVSGDPARR
jgi:hypothetical protein